MVNYLNSRWSPEGRNLLNSSGWEGYNGELDYRPERDGPAIAVPLPVYGYPQPEASLYYAAGGDDPMPAFKPGEVSSSAEPWVSRNAGVPVAPPPQETPRLDPQEAYENSLPEIRPFVSIGGKESFPYIKSMFGRNLREIADIARAQYPGAAVRIGVSGRPIITMPPEATQGRPYPSPSWGDGPEFAMEEVPIGGQEFQLDAPGVTLRDVANGGGQTALKVYQALKKAAQIGTLASRFGGPAGVVGALAGGAAGYYKADEKIAELARKFGARPRGD